MTFLRSFFVPSLVAEKQRLLNKKDSIPPSDSAHPQARTLQLSVMTKVQIIELIQ
jgi:hypothetical protein